VTSFDVKRHDAPLGRQSQTPPPPQTLLQHSVPTAGHRTSAAQRVVQAHHRRARHHLVPGPAIIVGFVTRAAEITDPPGAYQPPGGYEHPRRLAGRHEPPPSSAAPHRIIAAPGIRETHGPAGNSRSARMNPHSTAMVGTLIAPPTNISSISTQQQPTQ
jgi:hypothetical protein